MPEWMEIVFGTGICLMAVLGLLLFLVWPGKPEKRHAWVRRWYYAHRGLFTRDQVTPENSMASFDAAAAAGFGIELDITLTADRQLVVFHDDSLDRMCGVQKNVWEVSHRDLSVLRLAGTDERIPLFSEVLALVNDRVPMIVEIKSSPLRRELCEAAARLLDGYGGRYCIESFDPRIVAWFRRHRPEVLRGQLASRGNKKGLAYRMQWFLLRYLLFNVLTRPHFIAYRIEDARNLSFRLCRRLGALAVAWTVRESAGWATSQRLYDTSIFETWKGMPTIPGGERTGI
jgi:glycerophosphoryl diester phosphodiesterase